MTSSTTMEAQLKYSVGNLLTMVVGDTTNKSESAAWGQFQHTPDVQGPLLPNRGDSVIVTMPTAWATGGHSGLHGDSNPRSGATLAATAQGFDDTVAGVNDGAIDNVIKYVYSHITAPSGGKVKWRLAHEFGGAYSSWSSFGCEEKYVAAFRYVAAKIKAKDPDAVMIWCDMAPTWLMDYDQNYNKDGTPKTHDASIPKGSHVKQSYPGDDVVDVIAIDCYNKHWNTTEAGWESGGRDARGPVVRDLLKFCADPNYRRTTSGPTAAPKTQMVAKPVGFTEWGYHAPSGPTANPTSFTDDGMYYIQRMFDVFTIDIPNHPIPAGVTGKVTLDHECYFTDSGVQGGAFDIVNYPKTEAEFYRLFGKP